MKDTCMNDEVLSSSYQYIPWRVDISIDDAQGELYTPCLCIQLEMPHPLMGSYKGLGSVWIWCRGINHHRQL